jgi:hypothetical protein
MVGVKDGFWDVRDVRTVRDRGRSVGVRDGTVRDREGGGARGDLENVRDICGVRDVGGIPQGGITQRGKGH